MVLTREPGGAPGAEKLRDLLLAAGIDWDTLAEVLMHFAARAEHLARTIVPAVHSDAWVVCDRFSDSTMAYQGWGQGADLAVIARLAAMMPLRPDLTIVIDVPVETSLRRLADRGGDMDRYERLGAPFFARVRDGFLNIAKHAPERCVVISGDRSEDAVAADIAAAVRARL